MLQQRFQLPAIRDSRTTPRLLRVPVLALLGILAIYLLIVNTWALKLDSAPRFVRRHPHLVWFGGWKMFTELDTGHSTVEARIRRPGSEDWEKIDLEALFPTRWESGPRYARGSFRESGHAMRVLAQSVCGRLPERPRTVRLYQYRWKKKLGSRDQSRGKDPKRKLLVEWDCADTYPLPKGRPL